MSLYNNKIALFVRQFLRKFGLSSFVKSFFWKNEDQFEAELLKSITPGQVFWDVGANIGVYSEKASKILGPSGLVIAFEPSKLTFESLQENLHIYTNVKMLNIGLGDRNYKAFFSNLTGNNSVQNQVLESKTSDSTLVEIKTGDSLVTEKIAPPPNIIKIDVEGFEFEVMEGMKSVIEKKTLKLIGIEVHFSILKQRGKESDTKRIELMLSKAGFKLKWTDPSHLVAFRP